MQQEQSRDKQGGVQGQRAEAEASERGAALRVVGVRGVTSGNHTKSSRQSSQLSLSIPPLSPSPSLHLSLTLSISVPCLYRHLCLAARAEPN